MPDRRLESELADHLRVEFGPHGSRAVEFLESAQVVLDGPAGDWPRIGETVAYLCREALESITSAGGNGAGGRWRELSREVVRAADRYTNATQTHDEGAEQLLGELLRRINEVQSFHDEGERHHQQQLIAVIVSRAGLPPSSASGVIETFQDLFDRLNSALHSDCSASQAREMFAECIALIRKLFLPPEIRRAELRRLSAIDSPSDADVQALLDLVGTPVHLNQFVRNVDNPHWLLRLGENGVFDNEHTDVWWSLASAAERLGPQHAEKMSVLLTALWNRNSKNPERVQCISHAARRIGRAGTKLLLEVLRHHQDHHWVVFEAMQAALELDASASLVTDFADFLFGKTCWRHLPLPTDLADHFVAGINEHNAHARLNVLCCKLRAEDPDRYLLGRLRWDQRGMIAELGEPVREERSPVLVSCLVSLLRRVWELMPIQEVLETLEGLPEGLRERSRAWVLAEAPKVDSELLVSEVERSIGARSPSGDDVALVDRAVNAHSADDVVQRWKQALGEPPSVEEIGRLMASDSAPSELLGRTVWAQLLPTDATRSWKAATQLTESKFGRFGREELVHRPGVRTFTYTSPFGDEELGAMSPELAAEKIAGWQPGPRDEYHEASQLAQALRRVVEQAPDQWLSDPVGLVAKLHHPAYVSAYLQGIEESVTDRDLPVEQLVDVVSLVQTAPWDAAPLTSNRRDLQSDWQPTQRAGLDLIAAMATAGVQFGDRADQAWTLLYSAATDVSAESSAPMDDPLTKAINRDCTCAFDAAVRFVAAELRADKPVRAEFVELMVFALTLQDDDGEQFRAILARRLGWLRQALPDWTDSNIELLFGAGVPAELAQLTVDLAIQWGLPHRWLFETAPEMVRSAVLRDVDEAMDHFLIAMLGDWPGYQLDDVVRFVLQHLGDWTDLASRAGASISRILTYDGIGQQHIDVAARLWEELLDSPAASSLRGFGSMYLVGALDDERWAQLTLRTLESETNRGRWLRGAIKRSMQLPPSKAKLAVLNAIVRGPVEQWHRYSISESIGEVLTHATELQGTVEYRQLVTALREHDLIRNEPGENS